MLITPFIVKKLINQLQELEGCELISIFSNYQNSLSFQFDDGEKIIEIEFKEVKNEVVLFKKNLISEKQVNRNFFSKIIGEIVQNLWQINFDRILVLDFISHKLVFLLFGHKKSDILLTSHNFLILESFSKNYIIGGNLKEILSITQTEAIKHTTVLPTKEFIENKISHPKFNPKWLFSHNFIFQLFQSTIESAIASKDNFSREFYSQYLHFLNNFTKANEFSLIVVEDELLIIPTSYVKESKNIIVEKSSDNIDFLLSFAIYKIQKESDLKEKKDIFLKPLLRVLLKTQSLLKEYTQGINLAQLAENYKNYADILVSQSNVKIKLGENIEVLDFYSRPINIPLDKKLTLIENAGKYYQKHYKTKKDYQRREKELPILAEKANVIQDFINKIESCSDLKQLKKIELNLYSNSTVNIKDLKINMKETNLPEKLKEEAKFRKFELSENYTLFVGKDSKNNDELTCKFAKSNDIWLHAKGVGGSHCVIKNSTNSYPPKKILEEAAEICAYFSQARNAGFTPVIYTFKKYVHKPKGAAIGAVQVRKEEVIMVKPKEPII